MIAMKSNPTIRPAYCEEEWRDIPGYGGRYQASSLGRIRKKERIVAKRTRYGSIMTQRYGDLILSPCRSNNGYFYASLHADGKQYTKAVHHLVLLAFHGPRPSGHIGCHWNDVRDDNRPENLRWDTQKGNMGDRVRNGKYYKRMPRYGNALIEEAKATCRSAEEIVSRYGISRRHAYNILGGRR